MTRIHALLACCGLIFTAAVLGIVTGKATSPVVASAQDYPTPTTVAPSPRPGRTTVTSPFAAIDSAYAALGKAIDDAKAAYPTPQPTPTPSPSPSPTPAPKPAASTVFGVDVSNLASSKTWQQLADEHRAEFGALPHVREFSPTTPLTAHQPGVLPSDHGVMSFKSWDAAAFTKWMNSLTAESWVSYFHEPEDNAKKSGDVAAFIASWQQVYREMDAARKANPNG
ncbi:MAG: hypothetical protein ACXVGR_15900, partial [Mycobacteriaceae bacterium]